MRNLLTCLANTIEWTTMKEFVFRARYDRMRIELFMQFVDALWGHEDYRQYKSVNAKEMLSIFNTGFRQRKSLEAQLAARKTREIAEYTAKRGDLDKRRSAPAKQSKEAAVTYLHDRANAKHDRR